MRITERTLYATIAPAEKYFSDSDIKALKRAAEDKFGAMLDLPFATFFACANGDFSSLGDLSNPTVLQIYWCKRFADFLKEFAEMLKSYNLPQTADERKAAEGLLQPSWGESILVFLQSFFGLKSFKEAEQITVGEILIAKRAQYNRDKFQRNLSNIQMTKFKRK